MDRTCSFNPVPKFAGRGGFGEGILTLLPTGLKPGELQGETLHPAGGSVGPAHKQVLPAVNLWWGD